MIKIITGLGAVALVCVTYGVTQSNANKQIDSLTKQNTELTLQLGKSEEDKQKYYEAWTESARTIEAKQILIDSLTQSINESNSEIEDLNNAIKLKEENMVNLQTSLNIAHSDISKLQSDLNTANTNIDSLNSDVTRLNTSLSEKTTELETAILERNNIQSQLESATTDKEELQTALNQANANIETITNEKANIQNELSEKQTELTTVTNQKAEIQTQLDTAIANNETLTAEITTLTSEKETLTSQVTDLQSENEIQQATIQSLEIQVEEMKFDLGIPTRADWFTFNRNRLTGYTGPTQLTKIIIPSTYSLGTEGNPIDGTDYTVTRIECVSFFGDSEHHPKVVLPNTIEYIGSCAFMGSWIEEIFIPLGVTIIDEDAFDAMYPNLVIKCGATEKPAGWADNWNRYINEYSEYSYYTVIWAEDDTSGDTPPIEPDNDTPLVDLGI